MDRDIPLTNQALIANILNSVRLHAPTMPAESVKRLESDIRRMVQGSAADEAARSSEVTILLSDIRGFTVLAEHFPAAQIVEMLNIYFTRMNEIIHRYNGLIDKYMGDAIMVLFGTPTAGPDDAHRAVACAIEMQIAMDDVNRENARAGLPELFMGIGINTGSVSAGRVGSELHREYTVIGDGVNLASRIEAYSLRGQILISEYTYSKVSRDFELGSRNQVNVKGKADPIELYEIVASNWRDRLEVPRREIRNSPRVEVEIPFCYYRIVGKDVQSQPFDAQMKDIGYFGLYAHMSDDVAVMSDIKFSMSVSLLGGEVQDVYAKVTSVRKMDQGYGVGLEFTSLDAKGRRAVKEFVDRILESQ